MQFKYEWQEQLYQVFDTDCDQFEFLRSHTQKDYIYHLSLSRCNIIQWFPFTEDMKVLEIGCETGILTSEVALKVNHVDLIEKDDSLQRLCQKRLEKLDNITFIDTINKDYDVVLMIGTLEKLDEYSMDKDTLLKNAYQSLKPGGTLLLAFDNQFGLKYFAGGLEFNTLQPYHVLEAKTQYAQTKKDIEDVFNKWDCHVQFYYPFPDYRFTKEIYSDDHLPKVGDLYGYSYEYGENKNITFDENKVRDQIIQQDMFPFFANSYLVAIRKGDE